MLDLKTLVAGAGTVALLAGCSASYDEARHMTPVGTDFSKALHAGYVALARAEMDETDFDDARLFALRARSAALGNPEPVEKDGFRRIPAMQRDDVEAARSRLVAAFARGAPTKAPAAAAEAQLRFECWTQELEENIQPGDIAACKKGFETAMAALDIRLARGKAVVAAPPGPAASVSKPAKVIPASVKSTASEAPKTKYSVYFDLDKAEVKESARRAIDQAVVAARVLGATVIKLTGHADRAGPSAYNRALSARRADSVAGIMTQLDGGRRRLETAAKGEDEPAVPTSDGAREPRNRRVDIELIN